MTGPAAPRASRERHEEHVRRDGGYGATVYEPDIFRVEGDGLRENTVVTDDRLGYFSIEVCNGCSFIVQTLCVHAVNEWRSPDGTPVDPRTADDSASLICRLCGQDVT